MNVQIRTMEHLDLAWTQAMERYNTLFDNAAYRAAVTDQTNEYSNRLIDSAMAICGSPYTVFTAPDNGDAWAWHFLAIFTRG